MTWYGDVKPAASRKARNIRGKTEELITVFDNYVQYRLPHCILKGIRCGALFEDPSAPGDRHDMPKDGSSAVTECRFRSALQSTAAWTQNKGARIAADSFAFADMRKRGHRTMLNSSCFLCRGFSVFPVSDSA